MQAAENIFDSATVAEGVRKLMEGRGIPRRRQSKELTRILNLSFSHAHRKLKGTSPWTLEQLKKISEHFNEPVGTLDLTHYSSATTENDGEIHDAIFVVGERELSCIAWIGGQAAIQHRAEFVALKTEHGWRIVENCPALDGSAPRHQVEKIEIHVHQPHLPSIAVIDDDKNSADNLRDYLNETGFKATSFYSHASLEAAMQETEFDGYVVDWLLGSTTTEQLIRSIRLSYNSAAPIILLTGQLITGKANESDVARVIVQFNVICQEKPTRLSIIAAELSSTIIQS
ncbi:helix-turn-helix domain-containing protein [Collimonas pratensis]|uniref:Response regulator n=1 Tax=Collimonas pratensis TaxID=279113 RepID=A0A127QCK1_9BURK|nr:helix-turn-helix domain-containing protein [Collimonas pratensis]AMP07575.1 response regulator [Collimonas pratensis]